MLAWGWGPGKRKEKLKNAFPGMSVCAGPHLGQRGLSSIEQSMEGHMGQAFAWRAFCAFLSIPSSHLFTPLQAALIAQSTQKEHSWPPAYSSSHLHRQPRLCTQLSPCVHWEVRVRECTCSDTKPRAPEMDRDFRGSHYSIVSHRPRLGQPWGPHVTLDIP